MDYQILQYTKENEIGTITISRPNAMNALNTRFFNEMEKLLTEIRTDLELAVLIITGAEKAFVAGADIAEMAAMDSEKATAFSLKGQNVFNMIESLPIPVIAAINGFALGGGCELALACDIRLASENAKLGQPEVSLGLIPGYAGTQRLPRLIGKGNALYLLLSGEMIDAKEALNIGLVQKVFEAENLMNETMKLAEKISKKGRNALKYTKEVTHKGSDIRFKDATNMEAKVFGSLFDTNEAKEGMKAFLEKRKPNW